MKKVFILTLFFIVINLIACQEKPSDIREIIIIENQELHEIWMIGKNSHGWIDGLFKMKKTTICRFKEKHIEIPEIYKHEFEGFHGWIQLKEVEESTYDVILYF